VRFHWGWAYHGTFVSYSHGYGNQSVLIGMWECFLVVCHVVMYASDSMLMLTAVATKRTEKLHNFAISNQVLSLTVRACAKQSPHSKKTIGWLLFGYHCWNLLRYSPQSRVITGVKKAFNPGGLLVSVIATGTKKVGLKAPAFSPGCLRTGTNGPPRGPDHVLRLEDLWSQFVTQTGTKGPFEIKFVFSFSEFLYFLYFFISLFFLFL
jgi:hypothetical protein